MPHQHMDSGMDVDSRARLARMRLFQWANFYLFWLSMAGIFGGLFVGMAWQRVGGMLMMTGFAVMGLQLVESYMLYPRLLCPRCHHRFFLPDGGWHWLARVDPTRWQCLHCGLSLDET